MTDRFEKQLADLGREHDPPPRWQTEVWNRIDREGIESAQPVERFLVDAFAVVLCLAGVGLVVALLGGAL